MLVYPMKGAPVKIGMFEASHSGGINDLGHEEPLESLFIEVLEILCRLESAEQIVVDPGAPVVLRMRLRTQPVEVAAIRLAYQRQVVEAGKH